MSPSDRGVPTSEGNVIFGDICGCVILTFAAQFDDPLPATFFEVKKGLAFFPCIPRLGSAAFRTGVRETNFQPRWNVKGTSEEHSITRR